MRSVASILLLAGASLVAPSLAAPPTAAELVGYWSGFCFQNVAYTLDSNDQPVYTSLGDLTLGQAYTVSYTASRLSYWYSSAYQIGDGDAEQKLDGDAYTTTIEYNAATGQVTQPECFTLSYDSATGALTEVGLMYVNNAPGSATEYTVTCPTAEQFASAPTNSLSGNTYTILYKCVTYKMGPGGGNGAADAALSAAAAVATVAAAAAATAAAL